MTSPLNWFRQARRADDRIDMPARVVLMMLAAALALTSLTYHIVNASLESWVERRLTRGVTIEDLRKRDLEAPRDCIAMAPGENAEAAPLACALAFATSDRFGSGEQLGRQDSANQTSPRIHLLRTLITAVFSTSQTHALNDAAVAEFLVGLCASSPGKPSVLDVDVVFERLPNRRSCLENKPLSWEAYDKVLSFLKGSSPPGVLGLRETHDPQTASRRFLETGRVAAGPDAEEAFEDTVILLDGVVEQLQDAAFAPLRSIQALNGGIQWITIAAGWWCGLLLAYRYLRVRKLSHTGDVTVTREQLDARETQHYGLTHWLLEAIPTLGFIGTIYGMILAMGGAADVVGVQDQQALKVAMGFLSRNLGTAFDTTLVGLVLSVVLTRIYGIVRSHDNVLTLPPPLPAEPAVEAAI